MASVAPAASVPDPGAYGPDGRSAWLDVDWRLHQRWVTVAGEPVNVVDLGPGAPVPGPFAVEKRPPEALPMLFVHGLSGSWQNWLENLPFFAGHHRVIAVDLPGFGASPSPAPDGTGGRISIPGYAATLVGLLDELGLDRACVVGNSMGGFAALEMAMSAPERVAALVLVSPAGLDARSFRNDRLLGVLRRAERLVVAGGTMVATHADWVARRARLRRLFMHLAVLHPERLPNALMAEQIRQGNGKPGFVDALDALTDHDIEDRLGQITCPTLVYWGTEDRLVPVRDAARFGELIPGARVVVLEETGHMAMLERPSHFNPGVAEFLAGIGGGSGISPSLLAKAGVRARPRVRPA
jgi:pimeloyl-ACP methyl ester carboxylesterase